MTKKNLFWVMMMLALLIGLNACSTIVPGKIIYSEELTGTIEDLKDRGVNVKVNIMVGDKGQLLFYDAKGQSLAKCRLPVPDTKAMASKKQDTSERKVEEGVCQGMTKGSAVTGIQNLPILKTNSNNCMTFGPDASGAQYEFCW